MRADFIFLIVAFFSVFANGSIKSGLTETFDEELYIKSLPDGRVLTRFAFTTVLEGTAPRNPGLLGQDDKREQLAPPFLFLAHYLCYSPV
jgi:hypothetical protein